MFILARITIFISVLLCVYLMFGSLLFVDKDEGELQDEMLHATGVKISALFPPSPVKTLYLYVVGSDSTRLARMIRMLDSAGYPGIKVELVVVSSLLNASSVVTSMNWSLGAFKVEQRLSPVDSRESMVVFFEDFMEVSPLFPFWFLLQWKVPVILGGNDLNRPAGVAVNGWLWNQRFKSSVYNQSTSLGMFRDFQLLCDCFAAYPLLEDERVFVRNVYQSPVLPETAPRLVRTWNISRSQWNI
jgi:hypothetical protein